MKQRTDNNANGKFYEVKEKVQREVRRMTNNRGMKRIVFAGTGVLLLLLGIGVPASAQKDKEDKQDKHEQQGKPEKQAKPDKQQQQHGQAKGQQEQQRQQQAKGQQEQQRQQQAKGQQDQQRQQQAKGQQDQQRQQQAKVSKTSSGRSKPGAARTTAATAKPVGLPSKSNMGARWNTETHGSNTAHKAGSPSIALGSNAAATTATAFLTIISACTLVHPTGSAFTACPCWWLKGIPASSTAASGSAWLIRGRNIGQRTGTKQTTYISTTTMTDITCTTAGILAFALRLTSSWAKAR